MRIEGGFGPPFHFGPTIDFFTLDDLRFERWQPGDGALNEKRLMRSMEIEGYDVLVYTYRPGRTFPPHAHAQAKCDAVLEGTLRITVGEQVFDLKAGDRLYLPAGTRHAAEVVGEKTVVSLDGTLW
jgi:quercetin dioxygenase-like cupin family protein